MRLNTPRECTSVYPRRFVAVALLRPAYLNSSVSILCAEPLRCPPARERGPGSVGIWRETPNVCQTLLGRVMRPVRGWPETQHIAAQIGADL